MQVHIVSDISTELLRREAIAHPEISFSYSREPIPDTLNVYYGVRPKGLTVDHRNRGIFVMTEPPEIKRWSTRYLSEFRLVVAPAFDYVRRLPNFFRSEGLVPWRIGVSHELGRQKPDLSREEIRNLGFPAGDIVTSVVSGKRRTRMQRQRRALIRFLEKKIENLESYGRDHNLVADKYEALSRGKFHIAVENSSHPGYSTEKLADALLVGNTVFYGGHPESIRGLDERTVVLIDPGDHKGTLKTIQDYLGSGESEADNAARAHNRAYVLERLNVHHQICRAIEHLA